jgi:predicted lipoprotein with Yx(FWY)xxD motif
MIKSRRLPLYVAGGAGLSALAAVLGVTLSTGPSAATVTASPSSTVVQTRGSDLGQILVDAQDRTMYLFAKDAGPASTCTGACTSIWPPVPVSAGPHAAGGASASALGVIGSGSSRQLSYAGHPLYYFAGDSKAGQTRGQAVNEFGAQWFVLNPTGTAVLDAPSNTGTSGGYGY